jgi:hypothetical protein
MWGQCKMKSISKHLLLFLQLEIIGLCFIVSFQFINIESTVTLILFSFLFVSLIFQLNGTLSRKLCLLTIGNVLGLFWNLVFRYFSLAGALYFGNLFDVFYVIIFPFLNLMWIVPFWSLSLGILPKMQNSNAEAQV